MSSILIISTHADDETFGMGGTLFKLLDQGHQLHWLILTKVWSPKWNDKQIEKREADIQSINKFNIFESITHWDYKDNMLETYPKNELQENMIEYLDTNKPEIIFTPGCWDNNFEHKLTFGLVEISTKPIYSQYLKKILAYEIPSSTELSFNFSNPFKPNYYSNIEKYIDKKIEICKIYSTEIKDFPHARSIQYIKVLAQKRGVECGLNYAESFFIVKEIN